MNRSYYSNYFNNFLERNNDELLGMLSTSHPFELDIKQRNAWVEQIKILKELISRFSDGYICFEFTIPRMGLRADVILIVEGIIFILEFKVGESDFLTHDRRQVEDYALDLKNFHKGSHNKIIVPILIITGVNNSSPQDYQKYDDDVYHPINATVNNIHDIISAILVKETSAVFDYKDWEQQPYQPTPTIIEAAKALYKGHGVNDLTRSEGDITNLTVTTQSVLDIIRESKHTNQKSICFITGVPGAGKTLAGLNIVHQVTSEFQDVLSVYLSGNGPLIEVLQEALARDRAATHNEKKGEAFRKVKQFIQPIHHFRNEYISSLDKPIEKITVFDEAQRCWTATKLNKWMEEKKGRSYHKSEPESLIEIMNRHEDWCVVVCLIGGGQEIYDGEAGLIEWFETVKKKFSDWKAYFPQQILSMGEYNWNNQLNNLVSNNDYLQQNNDLHLSVSIRSFRSEKVSSFVEKIINLDVTNAQNLLKELEGKYPICLTRDLELAKKWITDQKRGNERCGILASSDAKRLKPFGINVSDKVNIAPWFLDSEEKDIRSSNFLEQVVTEFQVQGLELDWTIVGWDGDFSFQNEQWIKKKFRGKDWNNIHKAEDIMYKSNAYRVLLTRARQGMVLFIPKGDDEDYTRQKIFYDGTYSLLKDIGIEEIQ